MEPTENIGIELFAGQLPSIEEIKVIAGNVNSSEYDRLKFLEMFEENKANTRFNKLCHFHEVITLLPASDRGDGVYGN